MVAHCESSSEVPLICVLVLAGPRSQALMDPSRRAGTEAVIDASDVLLLTQVRPKHYAISIV